MAVLLLAAVALLWWLPARWALPWLQPSLHGLRLQQVSGTLWDGSAGQVLAPSGHVLGRLRWRLSRRAVLGDVEAQVEFSGPRLDFRGRLRQVAATQVAWDDVHARADLAALTDPHRQLPLGQPLGEFTLSAEHALLQGGWPQQLQAAWQWRHAVVRTKQGELALGGLHGLLTAQGGVIHAQWQDDGSGPLHATGNLQLSPLGWRLAAELQPRADDLALRRWLATLGQPGSDGTVHVERSGGLAAAWKQGNAAR